MTTKKARQTTTTTTVPATLHRPDWTAPTAPLMTKDEREAWAHEHHDQIVAVMRAIVRDDPDDYTEQGAMHYFGNPHPHYGEGSDELADDTAVQMTTPDSPFYAPDAPANLYDDGIAPDAFYDFAVALAREDDPNYVAPHDPGLAHPDDADAFVARVIAGIDPDLLSVLRAAEMEPTDYELGYESPRDPTLEIIVSVRSRRYTRSSKRHL